MNLLNNKTSPLFGLLFIVTAMAPTEDSEEDPPSDLPSTLFQTDDEWEDLDDDAQTIAWLASYTAKMQRIFDQSERAETLMGSENLEIISANFQDLAAGLAHFSPGSRKANPHPDDWSQWDGLRE